MMVITIWGIGLRKQQKMPGDDTPLDVDSYVKRFIIDCRASDGGYVRVLPRKDDIENSKIGGV